ncbi:hypothetical protein AYO46_08355 [Betaproteobacteria bacterium SCGC AG-212-J23]|nr:hypothetical protein AYO46_08355 [Betaproteobacteria bacterium SCGC AG-212-J23]
MLQVWLDASTDFRAHSLAGFVSTASRWARFSDQWKAALDLSDPPFEPIEVFKMGEMDLDYPPHLKRCEMLYHIIETNVEAAVAIAVPTEDLKRELSAFDFPRNLRKIEEIGNPYFWGFYGLLDMFLREPAASYLKDATNLFLDKQQEEERIRAAWRFLRGDREAAPQLAKLPFEDPVFRDDEKFRPLQAADMFAFWCRRWESEGRFMEGLKGLDFPWRTTRKLPRLYCRIDAATVKGTLHGALR